MKLAISFEADDRDSAWDAFRRIVEGLRREAESLGVRDVTAYQNVVEVRTEPERHATGACGEDG